MSTVLANTITAVGGGGSTVKVNNDSTYISDGGAVTDHNLVQGLVKTWASIKGTTSTELLDSFNVASVSDDATGKSTITITNDMTNDNYSTTTSAQENTCVHAHTSVASGSIQLQSRGSDDQAFTDVDHFGVQICGDLA